MSKPTRIFEYNMGVWTPLDDYPFEFPDGVTWEEAVGKAGYTWAEDFGARVGGWGDPAIKIYHCFKEDSSAYPLFCEVSLVCDFDLDVFFSDYPSLFMFLTAVWPFAILKLLGDIANDLEVFLSEQSRRTQRPDL